MHKPPKVSVILPVYNGEHFVGGAIESLLAQSFHDFELLIINDGSTDQTASVIHSYAQKDRRIRIFTQENKGLIVTLNKGIGLARGEVIARMDADDLCHPGRLDAQYRLINQGFDIVGCSYEIRNEQGKLLGNKRAATTTDGILLKLALEPPFAHGSVMARTDILRETGYSKTQFPLCEDYFLWVNLYNTNVRFSNVPDILYIYTQRVDSLSRKNYRDMILQTKAIGREFFLSNQMKIEETLRNTRQKELTCWDRATYYMVLMRAYQITKNSQYLIKLFLGLNSLKNLTLGLKSSIKFILGRYN